jgi:hypothetical protein
MRRERTAGREWDPSQAAEFASARSRWILPEKFRFLSGGAPAEDDHEEPDSAENEQEPRRVHPGTSQHAQDRAARAPTLDDADDREDQSQQTNETVDLPEPGHPCLFNDTAVQRRTGEGAQRPTRSSVITWMITTRLRTRGCAFARNESSGKAAFTGSPYCIRWARRCMSRPDPKSRRFRSSRALDRGSAGSPPPGLLQGEGISADGDRATSIFHRRLTKRDHSRDLPTIFQTAGDATGCRPWPRVGYGHRRYSANAKPQLRNAGRLRRSVEYL